jgi:small subunit ribosomal protein S13|tara:strand:+ start:32897 stop:33265 length:369 start_codon:yes stop_codon:yes gene_type:complete
VVRISGIDLQKKKRIEYALTGIYGIGLVSSQQILKKANVNPDLRAYEIEDKDVSLIREIIKTDYQVEGDLRRKVSLNIKRLSEINCIRGRRHRQQLPLRGQRTRTNARARRGPKQTMAGKKK